MSIFSKSAHDAKHLARDQDGYRKLQPPPKVDRQGVSEGVENFSVRLDDGNNFCIANKHEDILATTACPLIHNSAKIYTSDARRFAK